MTTAQLPHHPLAGRARTAVPLGEQMRELVSDTERYGYSNEQIGMSVMLSMLFTLDKDKYTGPKARSRPAAAHNIRC